MAKKKVPFLYIVGQHALLYTIIATIIGINYDWISELNVFLQATFFFILGLGGVMIYIPLGIYIEMMRRKHGSKS